MRDFSSFAASHLAEDLVPFHTIGNGYATGTRIIPGTTHQLVVNITEYTRYPERWEAEYGIQKHGRENDDEIIFSRNSKPADLNAQQSVWVLRTAFNTISDFVREYEPPILVLGHMDDPVKIKLYRTWAIVLAKRHGGRAVYLGHRKYFVVFPGSELAGPLPTWRLVWER
jgi:hypothetical protein